MKSNGFAILGVLISLVVLVFLLLVLGNNAGFDWQKKSQYKTPQAQVNTKIEEVQKQIDYSREQNNMIQGDY